MMLFEKVKQAKRVYICGNGGSAANALHMANDLVSVGIRAHALTGDIATLTAIANDFGYEFVFSKQILLFGDPGDLLIAMSGSGKSKNILNAIEAAQLIGMDVYKIFGNEHGMKMQAAEQYQIALAHELMLALKK